MSAKRVSASGWMEASLVVSAVSDRRNANRCDSETQETLENIHVSKVGGRKKSIKLIDDNLKQNNMRREVVAQR